MLHVSSLWQKMNLKIFFGIKESLIAFAFHKVTLLENLLELDGRQRDLLVSQICCFILGIIKLVTTSVGALFWYPIWLVFLCRLQNVF